MTRLLPLAMAALALLLTASAYAAAPGITGPDLQPDGKAAYLTQPDGQAIYSWGYGCTGRAGTRVLAPAAISGAFCNDMQVPGPTLIVHRRQTVTVTLTNIFPRGQATRRSCFPGLT